MKIYPLSDYPTIQLSNWRRMRQAQIFIILLILMFVVLILSTSLFSRLGIFIRSGDQSVINDQATILADGGVDWAIRQLNILSSYAGTTNPPLPLANYGEIEVTVDTGSPTLKNVTSTGYIPSKANQRAKRTVKTQVTVTTANYTFPYAVHGTQTGSTNTAVTLGGVTGNVHSKSKISCLAGSVIGAVTYVELPSPPACGTISTLQQTSPVIDPDPKILQDLTAWKNAAKPPNPQVLPPGCSTNCILSNSGNTTYSIGPAYIPGNLELGNFTNLALTGPVYIGGYLKNTAFNSFPSIGINPSLGACGTVIVVGGQVNLGDSIGYVKGTSGTTPKGYPLIISETSTSPAIKLISGDTTGLGDYSYLEAIFYAPYGLITKGSLNPSIYGAVVGNTVTFSSGSVTYRSYSGSQTDLNPAKFCGLGNVWQVVRGTYKISK